MGYGMLTKSSITPKPAQCTAFCNQLRVTFSDERIRRIKRAIVYCYCYCYC